MSGANAEFLNLQIAAEGGEQNAINCTRYSDLDHSSSAINCNFDERLISAEVPASSPTASAADYARQSLAENTRRAYASDMAHFLAWGGTIPASPIHVADYLAAHAELLSTATLSRRITTISKAHRSQGLPDPTADETVRATVRGIRRSHGTLPRQAKALVREDLFLVLDALGDDIRSARDRALLLLGFAGGFRRSEIVGLNRSDVSEVRQGLIVTIRRSKTDQLGKGRQIGIPHGRTRHCPVLAIVKWIEHSEIEHGPLFRPISRHGRVGGQRLSGEAVALVIKERLGASGIDPSGYSGHSLRSGFATSAAQAGISSWKIRAQTGHRSDAILARYIRSGELFIQNAVAELL